MQIGIITMRNCIDFGAALSQLIQSAVSLTEISLLTIAEALL